MCWWYEESISDLKDHLEVQNGQFQFSWHSPRTQDQRVPCKPELIILILLFFTLDSWTCRKAELSWSWHFVRSWNILSSRRAQPSISSVHRHLQLRSNKFAETWLTHWMWWYRPVVPCKELRWNYVQKMGRIWWLWSWKSWKTKHQW